MGTGVRPNRPTVISEIIDGEAVIIHLGTGNYYSLRGSASLLWDALEGGASTGDLLNLLRRTYDMDGAGVEVRRVVDGFLSELAADDLVVAGDDPAADGEPASLEGTGTRAFELPHVERYTDLQDLIKLDPVHDVDAEAGWPQAK